MSAKIHTSIVEPLPHQITAVYDLKMQEQAGKPNARLNSAEARRRADQLEYGKMAAQCAVQSVTINDVRVVYGLLDASENQEVRKRGAELKQVERRLAEAEADFREEPRAAMCRSTVSHSRGRYPLRCVGRSGLRSQRPAPVFLTTLASITACINTRSPLLARSRGRRQPPPCIADPARPSSLEDCAGRRKI